MIKNIIIAVLAIVLAGFIFYAFDQRMAAAGQMSITVQNMENLHKLQQEYDSLKSELERCRKVNNADKDSLNQ